jgi:hypothetical protein
VPGCGVGAKRCRDFEPTIFEWLNPRLNDDEKASRTGKLTPEAQRLIEKSGRPAYSFPNSGRHSYFIEAQDDQEDDVWWTDLRK